MCLDTEDLEKQFYEWQNSISSVISWPKELKRGIYNIGLTLAWKKQQECNLKEITKAVKDRYNDTER